MAPKNRTTSPAFQFYPKDFLSSSKVQRMSLTEIGAYVVLLSHNWLAGGIPADVDQIAKLLKMPTARFKRMWSGALSECFVKRGVMLTNERLDEERRKQIEYRRRQSDNGKKGGRRSGLSDGKGLGSATPSTRDWRERSSPVLQKEKEGVPLDVAFAAFRDLYPAARRKGGRFTEEAYLHAVHLAGGPGPLMTALREHLASEQWTNPRHIPGMDTWLNEERWRQTLPAAGESPSKSTKPDPWATFRPTGTEPVR